MFPPKALQTKITPPTVGLRTLRRPRVCSALREALQYRLTILQAGAGYGKSTALALLAEQIAPLAWYQVTEDDSDPLLFLLHLNQAVQRALPDLQGLPTLYLERWDTSRGPLPSLQILDRFINALTAGLQQPLLLVLDDVQLAAEATEIALILDRLAGLAPQQLHILLSSRPALKLPNLARWQARGEALALDQTTLAFSPDEIAALFEQQYGYALTGEEVQRLHNHTEGWAIALQLIWQNLRQALRRGETPSLEAALGREAGSLQGLFEILAHDVFQSQPADVQNFLLLSATLREMTPETCEALRDEAPAVVAPPLREAGSGAMLAYLARQELFVSEGRDGRMRYHPVFHEFLRRQTSPENQRAWHNRAALYFRRQGELDAALYHTTQAGAWEETAALLDEYGVQLLAQGLLDSLAAALDTLPPITLSRRPMLLFFLGELARLHSRFPEALGWYDQAQKLWQARSQPEGVARALRGQARVYLDTVNPAQAEALLQAATRLTDGTPDREAQARLYELLAENKLNQGRAAEAEAFRRQGEALRTEGPSDSQILFRVLLRTGRLAEARQALEARAEAERREPVATPRAHRETLLLLSLIYAFQGQAEQALNAALAGTQRGAQLNSPFITAVGQMRQGHALMLFPDRTRYAQARRLFDLAIEMSQSLAVPRLRVEAYWGLCRAAGYQGDLNQAAAYAQEGLAIALQAGDEWIASLIRLALGASLSIAGHDESAQSQLEAALRGFRECSDTFGAAVARLWLSAGWLRQGDGARLEQVLPEALADCQAGGYDFLFLQPSLLGPPDERLFTPLLIEARAAGWQSQYASGLLKTLGLSEASLHPGFKLWIYTLGGFQTLRGLNEIPKGSWRREKARQLFQLLLTFRSAPLERDQICEYLWPESDPAAAGRNFKVTLNTLYQALEPERAPGSESAFITREGSAYGLRPGADYWLDAQEFIQRVQAAEKLPAEDEARQLAELEAALALYQGEYLPEARYESWAAAEREFLAIHFLRAANRLVDIYLHRRSYAEVIPLCQRILAADNCWERAYRSLMQAYDGLGDRGQMARAYQRCVQTLRQELDIEPAPETRALYEQLARK